MKRRTYLKTAGMALVTAAITVPFASAKSGMLGKMGPEEFKKANEEAGMKVKAVMPDGKALSEDDKKLLMLAATGGMMQLELSKVAVEKASSEDVRMIAKAEVDEQTALAAKLSEIARSGGASLPGAPDEKTSKMVEELSAKSGLELDKHYLKESGVRGHEKLQETMEKVRSKAENPALKQVASAALPLIQVHLQVSKDESSDMA